MRIKTVMTQDVRIVSPDQTIQDAAKMMCEADVGMLLVGENDRLIGTVTDRDIACRAVARGKDAQTKLRDVMTAEVMYCFEDETADAVARNMADQQIRRLPVLNRGKRLVGVVALADLATFDDQTAGIALAGVSRPGGRHSQAAAGF